MRSGRKLKLIRSASTFCKTAPVEIIQFFFRFCVNLSLVIARVRKAPPEDQVKVVFAKYKKKHATRRQQQVDTKLETIAEQQCTVNEKCIKVSSSDRARQWHIPTSYHLESFLSFIAAPFHSNRQLTLLSTLKWYRRVHYLILERKWILVSFRSALLFGFATTLAKNLIEAKWCWNANGSDSRTGRAWLIEIIHAGFFFRNLDIELRCQIHAALMKS